MYLGGLYVLYVYAQMCLYNNNVCVVYMHVCGGSMCMFTSTLCLCMGSVYMLPIGAMLVSWGSMCMLCNACVSMRTAPVVYICDCGGQCVFLYVECLHICM